MHMLTRSLVLVMQSNRWNATFEWFWDYFGHERVALESVCPIFKQHLFCPIDSNDIIILWDEGSWPNLTHPGHKALYILSNWSIKLMSGSEEHDDEDEIRDLAPLEHHHNKPILHLWTRNKNILELCKVLSNIEISDKRWTIMKNDNNVNEYVPWQRYFHFEILPCN